MIEGYIPVTDTICCKHDELYVAAEKVLRAMVESAVLKDLQHKVEYGFTNFEGYSHVWWKKKP
jgi:hypothetical protein